MMSVLPEERPSAGQALASVHAYHNGFTRARLKKSVPCPIFYGEKTHEENYADWEAAVERNRVRKEKKEAML